MAQKKSAHIEGLEEKGVVYTDDAPAVEPVASNADISEIAREEAFMNEKVKVMLFPTTDANAPPYALISVNGERAVVHRATPTYVKRMHLEVLARMKETRVSQDMTPDKEGQITTANLRGHTALAYPFQVLEDKNPHGGVWLEHILTEQG
jgi:hypothetical protein